MLKIYILENLVQQLKYTNLLIKIGKSGGVINYMKNNKGFRSGVFSYDGFTTNKYISEKFGLVYKDLGLIMPIF